jgi:mannosyltransferase
MRSGQQIASAVLLAAIVAVAVFLRFDGLGRPSYWLDEILGQIVMARSSELPFWRWLGGVHPQHGPLYYLTQLLGRTAGEGEWAGRLCAALFGVVTVPLLWIAARRATSDTATAAASALLLAVSPLHVYYSREARPYGLLILLTTALLTAILLRLPVMAGCITVLMVYTSVGSAAAIVSAAIAALLASCLQRDSEPRRALRIISLAAASSLVLLPLLYRTSATDAVEAGFPGWNAALFDKMVRGLAVTALGTGGSRYAAYALLVLAIAGAIALVRRERAIAIVIIAMTLLPIAMNLAALRLADHFFAVRYITPALPAYLLLAGAGISAIARIATRRFGFALTVLVAAVLAAQGWSAARTEAFQKLDWRAIAQALKSHVHPGDVILAAEPWSEVSLRYYLGEIAGVKLIHMRGPGIAQLVADQSPAAWLVTAGATADPRCVQWMCRYPVLLSSPLEGFRLHYAPSLQHFLRAAQRAGGTTRRFRGARRPWFHAADGSRGRHRDRKRLGAAGGFPRRNVPLGDRPARDADLSTARTPRSRHPLSRSPAGRSRRFRRRTFTSRSTATSSVR